MNLIRIEKESELQPEEVNHCYREGYDAGCQDTKSERKSLSDTVTDIIDEVCSEMCDDFCKYPLQAGFWDKETNDICDTCPLRKL